MRQEETGIASLVDGKKGAAMEVVALIGPSGSGKSHRALLLSYELGARFIVDDGLLIEESRILAGKSAKREQSKMAAIRTAIFSQKDHAEEVWRELVQHAPCTVLIIGTSRGMVDRIAERLQLPKPREYLNISDVSNPEDIERALEQRREQNKHVIPVPTFEVKKTFSGYLVDPLRLLLRPRNGDYSNLFLVEKSVVRPNFSSLGKFYIADSVVMTIAIRCCLENKGIAKVLRAVVTNTGSGVGINLEVSVVYGMDLFDTLCEAQERVRAMVEHMTALNVTEVNVAAKKMQFSN